MLDGMRWRGRRHKELPTVVAKPPPEVAPRVDGGGPWGPTPFELPDPKGNHSAVLLVSIAAGTALVVLIAFLAWFYFHIT
jgi:hypothetical protein